MAYSEDQALTPPESGDEKQPPFDWKQELTGWLETLVAAIVAVALISTFVGRMMRIDGESMTPTLLDGERVITVSLYGELHHNDIVVIRRKSARPLVKRIIGLPGDQVDIDFSAHTVSVNGQVLDEPFINEPTERHFDVEFPVTVPEGFYFVMGDNRNYSDDSRHSEIGMIDKRNIFGKAVFRVWPLSRFGKIDPADYAY